jgi:O-antigen/teichoic acid export membrane protein
VSDAAILDKSPPDSKATGLGLGNAFAWTILGRCLTVGTALILTAMLARLLSPTEVGSWLLINNMLSLLCLLAMGGTNRSIVRFLAQNGVDQRCHESIALIKKMTGMVFTSLLLTSVVLVCFLIFWGQRFLQIEITATIVVATVALLFLRTFQQSSAEVFRGLHDIRSASLHAGTTGSGLSNLVLIVMVATLVLRDDASLGSVLVFAALSSLALTPVIVLALRRVLDLRLDRVAGGPTVSPSSSEAPPLSLSIFRLWTDPFFGISFSFLGIQVFGLAAQTADTWIAGFALAGDSMGHYLTSKQLVTLLSVPLQMVNLTILAIIPALHQAGRITELESVVRACSSLSSLVGGAVFLPLILLPGLSLSLVYGSEYAVGAALLAILTIGQLINSATGSCGLVLMMTGHQRVCVMVNALAMIAVIGFGSLATFFWGGIGLATVTSSVLAVQNLFLWYQAKVLVNVRTHPSFSIEQMTSVLRSKGRRRVVA